MKAIPFLLLFSSCFLIYLSANAQSCYTFNVKNYGALGDSSHDDTQAIQRTIDAAKGSVVFFPKGFYLLSAQLHPASPNQLLNLAGEDKLTTCLKALHAYVGNLLWVTHSIHIRQLMLVGNLKSGMTAIRAEGGSHGDVSITSLKLLNFDYGIRMDGKSEFPLKTNLSDIYIQNVLSCGIKMGTDSTPTSGQSVLELHNIVVTNPTLPGQRKNLLTLASENNSTGFGWCLMQRNPTPIQRKDGRPVNNWQTTHYVADKDSKQVKQDSGHVLVQCTVGLYFKHFKAIDAGVLQCEYLGQGACFDHIVAMNLGSFYYEWRQNFANPIPQGDALVLRNCTGVVINTGWAEQARSAVSIIQSKGIVINTLYANNCTRSGVNTDSPANNTNLSPLQWVVTGGQPAITHEKE